MRALVLGGTGFIGRRLVSNLLLEGNEVSLATAGRSVNPFGENVAAMKIDRYDRDSMMKAFSGDAYYDVAFDTIGYRSVDVRNSLDALEGKAGKYVYISSAAVYLGKQGTFREEDFDPLKVENSSPGLEKAYHEGKQMSEAYIAGNAGMPFAIARFPNVMGYDDGTRRFQEHVSRIMNGEGFHFQEPEGRRNCVWVEDAGKFLAWLGTPGHDGIYNGAAPDSMKASEFITKMAEEMGMKLKVTHGREESNSRYASTTDFILSVQKAEKEGFLFHRVNEWIGKEAGKAMEYGNRSPNSTDYTGSLFK